MDDVRIFFCKSNNYYCTLEPEYLQYLKNNGRADIIPLYHPDPCIPYRLLEQKDKGIIRLQRNVEFEGKRETIQIPEKDLEKYFEECHFD